MKVKRDKDYFDVLSADCVWITWLCNHCWAAGGWFTGHRGAKAMRQEAEAHIRSGCLV